MRTIIDRTDKSDKPKCNYCGSDAPEHGFTTKDVIHPHYEPALGKRVVAMSKFTVCKGKSCGDYLQMAHEG